MKKDRDRCCVNFHGDLVNTNSGKRVEEIKNIVGYFSKDYIKEADNIFILGDFNIEDTNAKTYDAATSGKFEIPDSILKGNLPGSNQSQNKIYDQILYYSKYKNIEFSKAGVYNLYNTVFKDFEDYEDRINSHYGKKLAKNKFTDFRSYQMSDHLPLWLEMKTDLADSYLDFVKRSPE